MPWFAGSVPSGDASGPGPRTRRGLGQADMTRRSKQVARIAAAGAALAVVAAAGVAERTAVAASFAVLGHLHWLWIPAAVLLEARVHGRLRDHAAQAARGRRRQRGRPADAGHRLCGQRGVGLGSAGRTRPGHGLHVPPLHPAGRGCPAGRLVAAGRRGSVLGCGGPGRGRRRAGVREHPGHRGHRSRRRARRRRPGGGGSGRAPAAAARRARAARRVDAAAGIPDAAPARRRSPPDHPGLG